MPRKPKAPRKRRRSLTGGWARLPIEGKEILGRATKARRGFPEWAFAWLTYYVDDFKEYPSAHALREATGWRFKKAKAFLDQYKLRFLAVNGLAGASPSVPKSGPQNVPPDSAINKGNPSKCGLPNVPKSGLPETLEALRGGALKRASDYRGVSDTISTVEEVSTILQEAAPVASSSLSSSLADELLRIVEEKHKAHGITPTKREREAARSALVSALENHGEEKARAAVDLVPPRAWRFFPVNLAERITPESAGRTGREAAALAHARVGRNTAPVEYYQAPTDPETLEAPPREEQPYTPAPEPAPEPEPEEEEDFSPDPQALRISRDIIAGRRSAEALSVNERESPQ